MDYFADSGSLASIYTKIGDAIDGVAYF